MKPSTLIGFRRLVCALALGGLLASCGGGGDSPSVVAGTGTDTGSTTGTGGAPSAADTGFDASYLPFGAAGSFWRFNAFDDSGNPAGQYQIFVSSSDGSNITLATTDSSGTVSEDYILSSNGLTMNLTQGVAGGTISVQPLAYAIPSVAVGETRSQSLSSAGSVNGVSAKLDVTYSQTLVGIDDTPALTVPQLPKGIMHFQNTRTITMAVSSVAPSTFSVTEDVWLAPGLGPVRIVRKYADDVSTTTSTYILSSLQVGSQSIDLQ